MKNSFFQDSQGNDSSSRLIAFVIIIWALLAGGVLIAIKFLQPGADILLMATASGLLFTTIAGPALAFLFLQKKTEVKQDMATKMIENESKNVVG